MRLEIIDGLRMLIIAFISYIITIPFAGWFESLIAKKVGDDAPEQAGFLTLNPLEHFNVFGFAAVLWGIFFRNALPIQLIPGWGRYIHLMPDNIRGAYYKLRIFIEYVSRSFAHLFLLIAAMGLTMFVCGAMNVQVMAHGFSVMLSLKSTPLKEVIVKLLLFVAEQNLVLFIIHFILGGFKYLIYFYMPKLQEISVMTMIFGFLFLLVGLSIFGPLLALLAVQIIATLQSTLLSLGR